MVMARVVEIFMSMAMTVRMVMTMAVVVMSRGGRGGRRGVGDFIFKATTGAIRHCKKLRVTRYNCGGESKEQKKKKKEWRKGGISKKDGVSIPSFFFLPAFVSVILI
jgi:hypothetical protein